jgi:hypothetical protein
MEGKSDPVNFEFNGIHWFVTQAFDTALMKGQNFGFAVGIAQGKHGPTVFALFKAIQNSSTDSTGWGIGFGPFRESVFQFFQLAKEGIKFLVTNPWLILDIVSVVVFVELADQFLDPVPGCFGSRTISGGHDQKRQKA